MKILITGGAGFIGFHLIKKLVQQGHTVVAIDNINEYYDINLKFDRLKELGLKKEEVVNYNKLISGTIYNKKLFFSRMFLEDYNQLNKLFKKFNFDIVCNLAAQAGVRYSLTNPRAYIDSNIVGFLNILECCRHNNISKLVYASSSSVYGLTDQLPFNESQQIDKPVSLYAASKKSNELMAHTYSHLYDIETIGLRFFTVYGPWGRPDMALFLFTDAILKNKSISVFNKGLLSRDFTFIDDIISGLEKVLLVKSRNNNKYKIYNIGNGSPVNLLDFIKAIEKYLGLEAKKNMKPMQMGDVYNTFSDTNQLKNDYDYYPSTKIEDGIRQFIDWYKVYYNYK